MAEFQNRIYGHCTSGVPRGFKLVPKKYQVTGGVNMEIQ